MADAGLNAVEKALLGALNVAGVTALVPAARHYNMVPEPAATYPVVVFSFMDSSLDGRAFAGDAEAYLYLVKGITVGSRSLAAATDIAEAIDAALDEATLSPTGYTGGIYMVRRQRWVRYFEHDEARVPYAHVGAIYKLWAHRSDS